MANVKKGQLTTAHEWWKHLRWTKRPFWKSERQAGKKESERQGASDDAAEASKSPIRFIVINGARAKVLAGSQSSQESHRLRVRLEATQLAIVRVMLRGFRRLENNELSAAFLDDFGQVVALERRHMPRTAFGAVVVARAGPFVGPSRAAALADVVVAEPGHGVKALWPRPLRPLTARVLDPSAKTCLWFRSLDFQSTN